MKKRFFILIIYLIINRCYATDLTRALFFTFLPLKISFRVIGISFGVSGIPLGVLISGVRIRCDINAIQTPLVFLLSSSGFSQASLRLTSGLPPIQGANLAETCPLVVRYLFDVLSNKYRTSTEELPNIFLCSSQGGSALHRS